MSTLKRYALEIYLPGSTGSDVACSMESNEPFLPIHKGELLNPRSWSTHYSGNLTDFRSGNPGILLTVTGIEHFIVQREDGSIVQHKLGIFTSAVDDVGASRQFRD